MLILGLYRYNGEDNGNYYGVLGLQCWVETLGLTPVGFGPLRF